MVLLEELYAIKEEDLEFQIMLHGGKVKNSKTKSSNETQDINTPLFGEPADYNHMSDEEKQIETDKMMAKHKQTKFLS